MNIIYQLDTGSINNETMSKIVIMIIKGAIHDGRNFTTVRFIYDPSVTGTWRFVTTAAGTSTTVNTGVTVANSVWYLLEMIYDGTKWTPIVNGTSYTPITTNIPTAAVNVAIAVENIPGGGARSVHIDYFSMVTRELGERY